MRVRFVHALAVRPRLLAAIGVGIAVGTVAVGLPLTSRLLVAWDVAIATHLVLIVWMILGSSHDDLQARADREDVGAPFVLTLAVLASLASLVAIGVELHGIKSAKGASTVERFVLVGATILLSWTFTQIMFGLHYAHDYYVGKEDRKGLDFPGKTPPDYWDFLYFSFTIGAAAQTSDVEISSPRMRRFALGHTIVAFLFNMGILALAVNVGAGLL